MQTATCPIRVTTFPIRNSTTTTLHGIHHIKCAAVHIPNQGPEPSASPRQSLRIERNPKLSSPLHYALSRLLDSFQCQSFPGRRGENPWRSNPLSPRPQFSWPGAERMCRRGVPAGDLDLSFLLSQSLHSLPLYNLIHSLPMVETSMRCRSFT